MAVLQRIQEAEKQADAIRADAQKQAREMLKATEAACLQAERTAAIDHRALYQQIMRDRQEAVAGALQALEEAGAQARFDLCEQAKTRIPAAAALIFRQVTAEGS